MWLEPVSECRPQHARSGTCRAAFHDEVFSIEEIGRIAAIKRKWLESRERFEHAAGPLPSIAQHPLHAIPTLASRMCIYRYWIPALEIEVPVLRIWNFIPPRVETLCFIEGTIRRAVPLFFCR